MSIEYDPSKTRQEMADAAGVSIIAVNNFLQRKKYDYRTDRANYLRKTVEEFFVTHPGASEKDAATELKLSLPTVKKYRSLAKDGKINSKKMAASKRHLGLSVDDTDSGILRSILRIYFPKKRTFDCDLTFGKGAFYSEGLSVPEYRYDKFLFGSKGSKRYPVKSLDEAESLPGNRFDSVVIDLPVNIDDDGRQEDTFTSLNSMFDSYHDMIALAARLLRHGGILVFKTVDFVLRNDEDATYEGQWATDNAIDYALEMGFDLTDRFILARRQSLVKSGSTKVRSGLKHGYFLVFTKL